jgi:hypothetical protein
MSLELTHRIKIDRRRDNPGPVLLGHMVRALTNVWRRNVQEGRRIDEIVVTHVLAWMARAYSRVTSFALAHALGPVWGHTLDLRRRHCEACSHRRLGRDRRVHCFGFPGGSCGCGEYRWWPFGSLRYRQYLRNACCPIGRFGRTRAPTVTKAPPPPESGERRRPSADGWR